MENKTTGVLLAIGLVIVAVVLAMNSIKQPTQDVMTVTGYSEMSVVPDKAEMYITIETTEETAILSQQKNADTSSKVKAALLAMGVKESDIETDSYSIYPKEQWDEKTLTFKQLGYIVTNTVKVTTMDIQNTGKFIDAAVTAGANRVERVVFALTDAKEKQVSADLLDKAGLNAKEKASSIAKNMGIALGKISVISESNYNIQPYNYYMSAGVMRADAKAIETSISPKNIQATAYLVVGYKI